MDAPRWEQMQTLFDAALARPASERAAFLDEACAGNPALRRELAALLAAHEEDGPLDRLGSVWTPAPGVFEVPPVQGMQVGPYRIVREIGRGGMGAVFLAEREDPELQQHVALKLVPAGFGSGDVLARFIAERQILAGLEHPHIARFLDGGRTEEGQPYLALEYVEGEPITRYCDEHQLSVEQRLALVEQTCAAVAYAHQNLVVHRDLKPSNILVATDAAGLARVKLLDFGIAKLLDVDAKDTDGLVTQTGQRWMTPEYAAPEQVKGEVVTTATDVYALGVLLYELLTGRHPYRITGTLPHEVERVILEQEPSKPSSAVVRTIAGPTSSGGEEITPERVSTARSTAPKALRRRLVGDLDTIVLKALQKDPTRRYASAEGLLDDLRRHREGLPVRARPDTLGYRARKFVRRHRIAVAAAGLLVVTLVGGLAATAWQARRATAERDRARTEAAKAEQVADFLAEVFAVSEPSQSRGEAVTARELLDEGAARIGTELAGQPEVQATMMNVIGRAYASLGLYEEAEPLLQRALALRRERWGEEHPDVAASLATLGWMHHNQGDYEQAEHDLREALALRRRLLGAFDPDLAASIHDLAWLLRQRGHYDEAEALGREALALRRQVLGEQDPLVAQTLYGLGSTLHYQGAYDEAEDHFRQAVAIYRNASGEAHPLAASALANLGHLYNARHRYDEAEAHLSEALAMRRRLYGPNHANVFGDLGALGFVLLRKGEVREAESLFREALAAGTEVLGEDDLAVASFRQGLAAAECILGDYAEGEALYRRALEKARAQYSPTHPVVVNLVIQQADCRLEAGAVSEAERLFEEAQSLGQRAFGSEHPYVARALRGLAEVAYARGDLATAESGHRQALALAERTLRPTHLQVLVNQGLLADVLRDRGRYAEADSLYRVALAGLDEVLPAGHLTSASVLLGQGTSFVVQGRAGEAEGLLRQALAIQERALPESQWHRAEAQSALGACLSALGRPAEAEVLLGESYAALREALGPDHRVAQVALERLTRSRAQPNASDS